MSLYDYDIGRKLADEQSYPFYGILMAAMRRADSYNLELLKRAFPERWAELQARYNAPGGIIEGDPKWLDPTPIEGDEP